MPSSFHQRCQLALTHPVTLGAVALLLVNDWLLKPLWSSDWTTGKLSDLAWMVFAPPLLLFALSLLVRGNARTERAAFLAAYAGLPLLYAAYNTFAPLHDWIMDGFMVLSGASAGSSLDPFDSLVIPPAMAAALWVWRQSAHSREGLRTRLHLYAVVIAALATVATSYAEDEPRSWLVGTNDNRVFVARSERFQSVDGGLTWTERKRELLNVVWGTNSVETPRGRYSIHEGGIVLTLSLGTTKEVYSFRHLSAHANQWAQSFSTMRTRSSKWSARALPITAAPYGLVYDQRTGNVVVGMGIQGVVVGDPNEQWRPYPVGSYSATDFSFGSKLKMLLSGRFWVSGLTISLCFIVGSLALVMGRPTKFARIEPETEWGTGEVLTATGVVMLLLLAVIIILTHGEEGGRFALGVWTLLLLLLVGPWVVIFIGTLSREDQRRRILGSMVGALGVLLGTIGLPAFQWHLDPWRPFLLADMPLLFAIAGLALSTTIFLRFIPTRVQLPAVIAAFVAMNVLLPLPFLLWLAGGVTLWLATVGAAALLTLTAIALYKRLVRQAAAETPA